jgi:rhodanese-related sulfurtransferase
MSQRKRPSKKNEQKNLKQTDRFYWILIIGGSLVLLVAFIFFFTRQKTPSSETLSNEISISQAYEHYQTGSIFLDVREKDEWREYHIPNSIHIPLGELEKRVNELPTDTPIVVVCRSGNRSQAGRDILLKAGFSSAASMAGGLKEWRSAGFPITSGD